MARVNFDTVFDVSSDNLRVRPRQTIRINGVTFSPNVTFTRGVAVGGIDITQYIGRTLETITDNEVTVITAIY